MLLCHILLMPSDLHNLIGISEGRIGQVHCQSWNASSTSAMIHSCESAVCGAHRGQAGDRVAGRQGGTGAAARDRAGAGPQVLTDHGDEVWHLAFSHSGRFLASGCKDGTACIWEVVPGRGGGRRGTAPAAHAAASGAAPSQSKGAPWSRPAGNGSSGSPPSFDGDTLLSCVCSCTITGSNLLQVCTVTIA